MLTFDQLSENEQDRANANAVRQQFVDDYLLVAMNDYDAYTYLREKALTLDTAAFATLLEQEWDEFVESLTESVGGQFPALLIGQMLGYMGSDTFYLLARTIQERETE